MIDRKQLIYFYKTLILLVLFSCGTERNDPAPPLAKVTPPSTTPLIHYTVVARHPHDTTSFTEGLLFHNNTLYESTGAPNYLPQTRSAIGIADLKTGKFEKKTELDKKIYFGEGLLILNNKVYQLTYQNQTGFIYDLKTFNRLGQFGYQNKEGWGMTTEGKHLIFSDGTCNLTYLDPTDFRVVRTLPVIENGYELPAINELEYIKGYIYANVWMTNRIVKIDPNTGQVVGSLDLSALQEESKTRHRDLNELNGIAYDSIKDRILITGKMWPDLYEISFPH
ncbi:MAG: glutaminyl-peptide cyclotransferase [bacterium]|nr:glutaminyl-peptide cyclotransferase [bacterium]